MRIFAASAMEIGVLGVGVLLLMVWTNHLKSTLGHVVESRIGKAGHEMSPGAEARDPDRP